MLKVLIINLPGSIPYYPCIINLLENGIRLTNTPEEYIKWKVINQDDILSYGKEEGNIQPYLDYNAIIISGSEKSVYQLNEIPWIKHLNDSMAIINEKHKGIKLVGLCFGHQLIGNAIGGKVILNPLGLEMGNKHVKLEEEAFLYFSQLLNYSFKGKKEEEEKKDEKVTFPSILKLHFVHNDIVIDLPIDYFNIGPSKLCQIQGIYNKFNILTFQGHPEFSKSVLNEFIDKGEKSDRFKRLPINETSLTLREELKGEDHNDLLAKIILNFILQ